MRRVSASSMLRTIECSAWLHLDGEEAPKGESAIRGDRGHSYLYDAVTIGKDEALKKIPLRQKWVRSIDVNAVVAYIGEDASYAEQALRYNVKADSAELIASKGRDYPEAIVGDVFGTADLIIRRKDGSVEVIDYKTGRSVGPAGDNWQMKTLALAVSRALDMNFVCVKIFYVNKDGSIEVDDGAVLGPLDLDCVADRIGSALGPDLTLKAGDHCNYCPARAAHCPLMVSQSQGEAIAV